MKKIFTFIEKIPVRIVEFLKKVCKCRTYHIEQSFVLIVLIIVALFSGKNFVEWIGVVAVFMTFGHASVSDRLEEVQSKRKKEGRPVEVWCHHKLNHYFYSKEILWLVYFIFLGAWSALVGVGVFLLYVPWRKLWRKYHPLELIKQESK